MGVVPTLAVDMKRSFVAVLMPTASVGMAPDLSILTFTALFSLIFRKVYLSYSTLATGVSDTIVTFGKMNIRAVDTSLDPPTGRIFEVEILLCP
jgi:hypothetical protein